MNPSVFTLIHLDDSHGVYLSHPIEEFLLKEEEFDQLWRLHPEEYHTVSMHGKEVVVPRWQQAYGKNYRYTGSQNNALPIPNELAFFLSWARQQIDPELNGLLLNWYDGQKNHYIGAHRDDRRDLKAGSPIVTISLGQERVFRMRPYRKKGFADVPIKDGEVIVIPWETNLSWTHEVPPFKRFGEKRISVTIRSYL